MPDQQNTFSEFGESGYSADRYPDEFVGRALLLLQTNKGDVGRTAAQLQIRPELILNWRRSYESQFEDGSGFPMDKVLEQAIAVLFEQMPETMRAGEWTEAMSMLLDKWLAVNGQATARIEVIMNQLSTRTDAELDNLILELEARSQSQGSDFSDLLGGEDDKSS